MKKRWARLLSLLCLVGLCGCSQSSQMFLNVEDLLRAPQPQARQAAVQSALNSYTGSTVQLRYPRVGNNLLPIRFSDLDGDGRQEAVVLYALDAGGTVNLAVLEQQDDESWRVADSMEGLSAEIAQTEFCRLQEGSIQIAVGYTNSNFSSKYFSLYGYTDETLSCLLETPFVSYAFAPLTDRELSDLVLIPAQAEAGALQLQHYAVRQGEVRLLQTQQADARITSCLNLCTNFLTEPKSVILDGALSDGRMVTEVFLLQKNSLESVGDDAVMLTARRQTVLSSMDIDNDGVIEVPQIVQNLSTLSTARRFYTVQWNTYSAAKPIGQTGIFDAVFNLYIALPDSMLQDMVLMDGNDINSWRVCSRRDNSLYFSVSVLNEGAAVRTSDMVLNADDKKISITFGVGVSADQRAQLKNSARILGN